MATAVIPPWLNRPDFIAAMQAGEGAGLDAAKIAENARQANMEDQLGRLQLDARTAEAQDRTALTEQDMLIQQQLKQQTEMRNQIQQEIDRAKDDALIGLKRSELDMAKKKLDDIATATARKYQAQTDYQSEAAALIGSGVSEEEAYMRAALKHGPAMQMPGTELSAMIRSQPKPTGPVQITDVPGQPDFVQVTNPDGSVAVRNKPRPVAPQQDRVSQRAVLQIQNLRENLRELKQAQAEGTSKGWDTIAPEKVNPRSKAAYDAYQKRRTEIAGIQQQIDALINGPQQSAGTESNSFQHGKYKVTR